MVRAAIALAAGALFGAGLVISGMVNPARVLGFLDVAGIAKGTWDPTLAFVMAGALAVAAPAFWLGRRRARPLLDTQYHLPPKMGIDRSLLAGAVLFGLGWGLVGFCPGPALAALGTGRAEVLAFAAAMAAGMVLYRRLRR